MFTVSKGNAKAARDWFESPVVTSWRAQETALLSEILPHLSGYRGVYIGAPPITPEVRKCVGTLRMWRADRFCNDDVDICIKGENLPFSSGSIDVLVLLHALELGCDPQAVVRECARVLSPRGQIVCLVFNPLSLWAATQRLRSTRAKFTPCAMPPRAARLSDWLRLLEFETTACWRYGPHLPLLGRTWRVGTGRRWLAPVVWTAPGYAIVARRRTLQRIPPVKNLLLKRCRKSPLAPSTSASGLSSRS